MMDGAPFAMAASVASPAMDAGRLPWSRRIQKRFGIDQSQWMVLTEIIFPEARSERAIEMALAYCKLRSLDVFKRPVHIVQVLDGSSRAGVDTIWPGIAELRTMAMRTGQFAGIGPCEFGEALEKRVGEGVVRFPEWARCTVYRVLAGQRMAFVGPKVFWEETYGRDLDDERSPNAIWRRRPRGQLEKCAEAAALRRAFPEELGSEYAAEEIDGQRAGKAAPLSSIATSVRHRLEGRAKSSTGGFSHIDFSQSLGATGPDVSLSAGKPAALQGDPGKHEATRLSTDAASPSQEGRGASDAAAPRTAPITDPKIHIAPATRSGARVNGSADGG